MRRILFIIFSLICLANIAGAQYIMIVGVNDSGDSQWTLEKRLVLTKTELKEWEGILNSSQNMSRYNDITELSEIINRFNTSTQNFTNRSMKVEEFNSSRIFYDTEKTASNSFGIIRYKFEWKNFSSTDTGIIYVGDAFSNDMLLSSENVLIIEIPEGYKVLNSSPIYDRQESNRLIWEGKIYQNFTNGEPALILSRINRSNITDEGNIYGITLQQLSLVFVALIGLTTFSAAGILVAFFKRRNSRNLKNSLYADLINAQKWRGQLIINPSQEDHDNESIYETNGTAPMPSKEILSYEEMIEQYLIQTGGQAFQSNIVKELGLSKSTISNLLADMKEKGRIIKIKKGKENLIRLANNQAM